MKNLTPAFFVLLMLAHSKGSYAARCVPADDSVDYYLMDPSLDLESSDLVARVAINRSFANVERGDGSFGGERLIYVAKVLLLWKGPHAPFVQLTNVGPGAREFEPGKEYLVFAKRTTDGLYFAHWCGGTVDAVHASPKQKMLGAPVYEGS